MEGSDASFSCLEIYICWFVGGSEAFPLGRMSVHEDGVFVFLVAGDFLGLADEITATPIPAARSLGVQKSLPTLPAQTSEHLSALCHHQSDWQGGEFLSSSVLHVLQRFDLSRKRGGSFLHLFLHLLSLCSRFCSH